MSTLLSAKDLQAKIALAEGEKASAAAKAHAAAEAEKQAFLERLSKPSGLDRRADHREGLAHRQSRG